MASVLPVHLSLCGLLQTILLYGKILDGLYSVPYSFILSPTLLGLAIEIGRELLVLLNRSKLSRSQGLNAVVYLVSLCCLLCSVFFLAEMLDWKSDTVSAVFTPLFFALCLHLSISFYKSQVLRQLFALSLNCLTPALNVCTMTGGCSSFYASTLTSLVSAFGITVLDVTHVLIPVTFVLVVTTLYSIYYSTHSLTYPPLLVALVGALLITLSHCVTDEALLLYSGNLVLVGGVLWNNKLVKDITSVATVGP
jgi:hypothetical protein